MRVIGVIDLLRGRAVHARGGHRDAYQPVGAVAGAAVDGDPMLLARTYVEQVGVDELYVADLDAIGGATWNEHAVRSMTSLGVPVWLDAGIRTAVDARRALADGAAHAVVGLETLAAMRELAQVCAAVGGERVAFSLDLRAGTPVTAPDADFAGENAESLAKRAAAAGAGALIVLDLARVGMRRGIDINLVAAVRKAAPGVTLVAGGGVREADDLRRLADAGCDAALVATALHDGRLVLGHGSDSR